MYNKLKWCQTWLGVRLNLQKGDKPGTIRTKVGHAGETQAPAAPTNGHAIPLLHVG